MNTIVEELRRLAEIPPGTATARRQALFIAANEIEALQKENAELRKQIAELTVKKTQVYNPPKPAIGNFFLLML